MSGTSSSTTLVSFVQRKIDVVFTLAGGAVFAAADSNAVTLSGLRVSARITFQADGWFGNLDIRIYGMTASLMKQLSQLPLQPNAVGMNTIQVLAGDAKAGMAIAFEGDIIDAFTEFRAAPDVFFSVRANGALLHALKPVPARSYKGAADAATIMSDIARSAGLAFENSGVTGVILHNQNLPGTAYEQAERVMAAGRFNMYWENGKILAIWPYGSTRNGQSILISPQTGLVGYAVKTQVGADCTILYNPLIRYGCEVQVKSSTTNVSGNYTVLGIDHTLESETPQGQWFTALRLGNIVLSTPKPPTTTTVTE